MRAQTRVGIFFVLAMTLAALVFSRAASAQAPVAQAETQAAAAPASSPAPVAAAHDGQHDFDWIIGTWKVHLKKLQRPLTGSTTWDEFEGTSRARKVWDGRANLDELIVHHTRTKAKLEGLTLRLYNPESHEWSLYWANGKNGVLGLPPTVGRFTNGRGEFYDKEEFAGRQITVRYIWSDITPTSAKFEQAFSVDDGKTWEPNWIATFNRAQD